MPADLKRWITSGICLKRLCAQHSAYARTRLFEMAKWLEESQNLLDWIEKTPAEKQAWMEQVS